MPETIGGTLIALAGVAVLVIRYRRRDQLFVLMPLVPIGFGLLITGALVALGASPGWIIVVVAGSIIIAIRRVPLVLLWTGRISKQRAALLYASVLPVAVLVVSFVTAGVWSWLMVAMALFFFVSYGMALGIFAMLNVTKPSGSDDPRTLGKGSAAGQNGQK